MNSVRRTVRISRNSSGLIRPTEYTITTAARVASGIRPMKGASNRIVPSASAAVTSPASCVRAPASRFTAVCVVPPPAGMAPSKAPPMLANPVATSSRLGCGVGSSLWAKARPAAIVSVKLISAMPMAAGQSWTSSCQSGSVTAGSPVGTTPTVATPKRSRPNRLMAPIPIATATSGAGARGAKRFITNRVAIVKTAMATVGSDACGKPSNVASKL
ncbi:hypothetical protein FQZ97_892480 [compost metagenome]